MEEDKLSHSGITNLGRFRKFYTRWRSQPFPPGSQNEELDELHAELALLDVWIADYLLPFALEGRVVVDRQDVLAGIEVLRGQLARVRMSEGELQPYRDYLDVAADAYRSFLEVADSE